MVPVVTFVTRCRETPVEDPAAAGTDVGHSEVTVYEDSLCPDCLSVERQMGRVLAPVLPFKKPRSRAARRA
ncbi:MAG: hypothetical protein QOG64_3096 [Acidimicrobiaceae bacterium]|nr:hypothetical protein [Acidimicrobiaceae bacterium]